MYHLLQYIRFLFCFFIFHFLLIKLNNLFPLFKEQMCNSISAKAWFGHLLLLIWYCSDNKELYHVAKSILSLKGCGLCVNKARDHEGGAASYLTLKG